MPVNKKNIRNTPLGDGGKYRHLFFDLDHTLWDFEANAHATLKELHHSLGLEKRGINDFDLFHKNYLAHNEKLWECYRNGLILYYAGIGAGPYRVRMFLPGGVATPEDVDEALRILRFTMAQRSR